MDMPLLTAMILLPLLAVPVVMLIPRQLPGTARAVALAFMFGTLALALVMVSGFDGKAWQFQYVETVQWIGTAINYKVGVDGISLWLVALTTFLTPIALVGAWTSVSTKVHEFCIALLVLEAAMLGTFLALDLFLFYVFWELMLIPMYLIIGIWGGERKIYATFKFVLYTLVGSLLMLVALIYIYMKVKGQTLDYENLVAVLAGDKATGVLSELEGWLVFGAFTLAFLIKVPVFPLHTWLPDAHVEAPTPGSVILAGVLLKMGTYGLLRFSIPLFPDIAAQASPWLIGLGAFGVVYGSLMAYAQKDIKKLVAYSSVAHMGLIVMGIFAMTREGIDGAVLQMVNHGISTGALFLCIGMLYERRHTRLAQDYGGIARVVPAFAVVFMIVTLSSIGVPGTNGFVGEFLLLAGVFKEGVGSVVDTTTFWSWRNLVMGMTLLAATGIILSAVYMLTLVRRVMFGPVVHNENRKLKDLNLREKLVAVPMIAMVLFIGLYPNFFIDKMHGTNAKYVKTYQDRMMMVRNKETYDRNARVIQEYIRAQVEGSMGAAVPPQVLDWKVREPGDTPAGGGR